MTTTPLPDALRTYRAGLGLSQRALADRWHTSRRNIENWETGTRCPVDGPIRRLMELDVKPSL